MTTSPYSGPASDLGTVKPVRPAFFPRVVMTPVRGLANRRALKRAGRAGARPVALLGHTGRRSGRVHVTPVAAWLNGEVIVVSLTFGNQTDWVRNVVAAGRCSIRVDGRDYEATHPEFLGRAQARELYRPVTSRMERASFRLLGIRQFMRLHAMPVAP
jgi:deazaflavin-dependent oxidoreductase (nitroreductase family)